MSGHAALFGGAGWHQLKISLLHQLLGQCGMIAAQHGGKFFHALAAGQQQQGARALRQLARSGLKFLLGLGGFLQNHGWFCLAHYKCGCAIA
jgi:hypothetical protein